MNTVAGLGNVEKAPLIEGRLSAAADDLCRRIVNFLHARNVPCVSFLEVEADGGIVVIRGCLPSPYAKRLCVECCQRVAGVVAVIDELEVGEIRNERMLSQPA